MISRHWRGVAKHDEADNYIAHLRSETFPSLREIDGFVSGSILRRDVENGVEFRIVTTWQSMRAIQMFAGDDADVAVVPPVVQTMMTEYDRLVAHYEVVEPDG